MHCRAPFHAAPGPVPGMGPLPMGPGAGKGLQQDLGPGLVPQWTVDKAMCNTHLVGAFVSHAAPLLIIRVLLLYIRVLLHDCSIYRPLHMSIRLLLYTLL